MNLKIITLLSDFGTRDGYPGIMKGVILAIAPGVQLVDLTHEIAPQDILSGALALGRAAPYFPAGTIHLAVVDPGVGTARRAAAVRLGDCTFVGPDNGLCTLLLERAERTGQAIQAVELNQPRYWLAEPSQVFHGRDIFAPAAAHLAWGVALGSLGTPINDLVRLALPQPRLTPNGWEGEVVHIDAFGNLATNITLSHLGDRQNVQIRAGDTVIGGLSMAYGDGQPGELVALFDSSGRLSIAMVNGNAALELGLRCGAPVLVTADSI